MKRKILSYLLIWLCTFFVWWQYCMWGEDEWRNGWEPIDWWALDEVVVTPEKKCDGIKLNTKFPIIWDCISTKKSGWTTTSTEVFPVMMWALTKIVITLILVVCFILVIVAWIKRSSDDPKTAKSILTKVAVTILLLWFSGVILRLINPNFFG